MQKLIFIYEITIILLEFIDKMFILMYDTYYFLSAESDIFMNLLRKINFKLFIVLIIQALIPSIYSTFRIYFIRQLP